MSNRWPSFTLLPSKWAARTWATASLVGLLLLATSTGVLAQSSYQIEVAVADKSPKEQQEAYQVALRKVLLNNSPDKTLLNKDSVRSGIARAEQYVDAYRYRSPTPGTVIGRDIPVTNQVRSKGEATQLMLIAFNPTLVQELIRPASRNQIDAPVLQVGLDEISRTLMWIMLKDKNKDVLVGGKVGGSVMQRARELAGANGIQLMFPKGEPFDLELLTGEMLEARDSVAIAAAATQYASPVIVTAYLVRKRSGGWASTWSKVAGEEAEHQDFEAETLEDMLNKGIAWLKPGASISDVEYEYGGDASENSEGLVWVNTAGVATAYSQVMKYLKSIESIASVNPKEIGPMGTVFAVKPRYALNDIVASAQTLDWLRRTSPPTGEGLPSQVELAFDFLP